LVVANDNYTTPMQNSTRNFPLTCLYVRALQLLITRFGTHRLTMSSHCRFNVFFSVFIFDTNWKHLRSRIRHHGMHYICITVVLVIDYFALHALINVAILHCV